MDLDDREDMDPAHIHTLLGKFFFTANIPFRQVGNKFFKAFVKALLSYKSQYKLPCRQTLADTILDKLYNEILEKKKVLLENTESSLMVDEWRNKSTNCQYLVFTIRNVNITQTFLSFVDVTNERGTGINLSKHINDAITYANNEFNTKVVSIASDNAANIRLAASLSQTVDNKRLLQSTCASHSGNLLIKSMADNDLIAMIREILNIFKQNPAMEVLITKRGGTKLKSLADTRFCYLRDSCLSIQKNLPILRDICDNEDVDITNNVRYYIGSPDFEDILSETLSHLNPVCELINKCQHPKCNVADATELWLSLKLPTDKYDNLISLRKDKAISPVGYAANLLHHKYSGKLLNNAQETIAKNFLKDNMDELTYAEYETYRSSTSQFEFILERCEDPTAYWLCISSTFPNLSKFAIKVMTIPGSTALIESLFSQWTYVHNHYRNKLGSEKSSHLVDIYHTLIHED